MFDQNVIVDWAKSHNVESTARNYCLSCVNNYLVESPEDEKLYFGKYYSEKLMLELEKVYCIINWNEPEYSHIIALVPSFTMERKLADMSCFIGCQGREVLYESKMYIK